MVFGSALMFCDTIAASDIVSGFKPVGFCWNKLEEGTAEITVFHLG
jgi:hypothetical protein